MMVYEVPVGFDSYFHSTLFHVNLSLFLSYNAAVTGYKCLQLVPEQNL